MMVPYQYKWDGECLRIGKSRSGDGAFGDGRCSQRNQIATKTSETNELDSVLSNACLEIKIHPLSTKLQLFEVGRFSGKSHFLSPKSRKLMILCSNVSKCIVKNPYRLKFFLIVSRSSEGVRRCP